MFNWNKALNVSKYKREEESKRKEKNVYQQRQERGAWWKYEEA